MLPHPGHDLGAAHTRSRHTQKHVEDEQTGQNEPQRFKGGHSMGTETGTAWFTDSAYVSTQARRPTQARRHSSSETAPARRRLKPGDRPSPETTQVRRSSGPGDASTLKHRTLGR